MFRLLIGPVALLLSLVPSLVSAQGLLVNVNPGERVRLPRPIIVHPQPVTVIVTRPQPTSTYKIKELAVNVRLADQVARTQVSQTFVNTGSTQMEVCFVFPLPYDGAIDKLTLMIDGKEHPAKLLEAKEARRLYEEIVRKNQDPALLEWMGNGMFKTSVFPVPAGAERKVTLNYSQLCRKNQGLTDFLFPLSTAKYTSHPVEKVSIQVNIEAGAEIKNVYSPTHSVEIKRPDSKHATVSFTSTNQVPSSDFRVFYDVGQGAVGANLLSYRPRADEEGYFLLLASPEIKAADAELPKKTVLFVVDRSGSMSGEKFQQAKDALKFVLNNLKEGDLFNIVAYDSQIESFRPELQKFDDQTRAAAIGFVEGLYAGGSTNIEGALRTALDQLKDSSRTNLVIFLTDGLPTDGETNEAKIAESAKSHNDVRARLFTFGVGYDVNSRLLDKLARENFGQSEYVRPNENIETHVSRLYNRIGSPVMTDVTIQFEFDDAKAEEGPAVSRTYPSGTHDLFAGEQLVLVGRYKKSGTAKVVVTGKVGGQEQKFDFPATFVEKSSDETNAFVEKLWAIRRIGEIIDELDLKGKNEELVKELVQLSTKHGVLTPYTSFLADEQTDRRDLASNTTRTFREVDALGQVSGARGIAQRIGKAEFQRARQLPASGFGGRGGYSLGALADEDAAKTEPAATTIRTIGSKTFYRRDNRWVDAALTADQEQQPIKIERFSAEYFELIDRYGKDVAKYLTVDEPVVIELGGQAYAF